MSANENSGFKAEYHVSSYILCEIKFSFLSLNVILSNIAIHSMIYITCIFKTYN